MASIGALGIGLSVVFAVFLVLLLAELYYLLFWKRKSPRINSVAPNDPASLGAGAGAGAGAGSDVQHPSIVAKVFGDGLSAHIGMVGLDGECVLAPPRLLFTIREETREDLVDSEDAMKKPRLVMKGVSPTADHVVVQVFQPGVPDVRERERSLLHVSTSSEASTSSSRSSGDEQVDPMEDVESGLTNRVGGRDEDEETICTTPFLTPPSSPGLSTPSSSPLRSSSSLPNPIHFQAHRGSSSSSCYESPPSPPLVPMPVLPRNNSTGSSRSLLMNSPPLTPPSTSSRESKRSKRHLGLEDARVV